MTAAEAKAVAGAYSRESELLGLMLTQIGNYATGGLSSWSFRVRDWFYGTDLTESYRMLNSLVTSLEALGYRVDTSDKYGGWWRPGRVVIHWS